MGAWGEALLESTADVRFWIISLTKQSSSDMNLCRHYRFREVVLRHNAFKLWVWCEISLALIYNVKTPKSYHIYSLTDSNRF